MEQEEITDESHLRRILALALTHIEDLEGTIKGEFGTEDWDIPLAEAVKIGMFQLGIVPKTLPDELDVR